MAALMRAQEKVKIAAESKQLQLWVKELFGNGQERQ
jgi:hypothetical protein